MFSVVIPTENSERALVPTLAALVAGATAGLVRDVIVADAGSTDETAEVAEIAGCRFLRSAEPLGARLAAAARDAKGPWLMFLRPGVVPEPTWIEEADAFVEDAVRQKRPQAAVFSAPRGRLGLLATLGLGAGPSPDQGLLLPKSLYDELGGHRAADADPEAALLRRIGRRRIVLLRSSAKRVF